MRAGSFRLPEKRASASSSLDVDDFEPQSRPRVFSLESVSRRTRARICAEDSQLSSSHESVDIQRNIHPVTSLRDDVEGEVARSSVSAREKKRRLGFPFFRKSLPPKVEQSLSLGESSDHLQLPPPTSSKMLRLLYYISLQV